MTEHEADAVCVVCGTVEALAQARVEWVFGQERGRVVWTCAVCSRRHARGIEGKLDSEWW